MDFDGIHCVECGGENFRIANDSILKRKLPFVRDNNLMLCQDCGAKFVKCDSCGKLFTRVHLDNTISGVTESCANCKATNENISRRIKLGIEGFGNY